MGVQPPEVGDAQGESRTPTGLQDHDSEDDLFSDTGTTTTTTTNVFKYNHDIDFRNILPVLPAKGVFEDFLCVVDHWDAPNDKKKYCGKCFEDVKRDLKKLAEVVDTFRNERDEARKETELLKKEVEELKKVLREKEEAEKANVKINIANGEKSVEMIVKDKDFGNISESLNSDRKPSKVNKFGISSISISLPKGKSLNKPDNIASNLAPKTKKTIAELRKEFFAKEFESQQETFTTNNYIEIKPEEKKETFRSKLNIRVKPKKKISELISKLTSRFGTPKIIPDSTEICMFQRFEKTKIEWVSEFEEKPVA